MGDDLRRLAERPAHELETEVGDAERTPSRRAAEKSPVYRCPTGVALATSPTGGDEQREPRSEPPDLDDGLLVVAAATTEQEEEDEQHDPLAAAHGENRALLVLDGALPSHPLAVHGTWPRGRHG